tara:strand:- start:106 stop:291 length:186 start_codon:yes stop_codon:yes gene_type:complete
MDKKITTVKVLSDLYNDFKRLNIDTGFSLQKLVNRSMFLYVNDDKFQNKIEETQLSGSKAF